MEIHWTEYVVCFSTLSAAVATVAAVICALRQLKVTLPHIEEQRAAMIKNQKIAIGNQKLAIENQEIAIRHQQNSVVMDLWRNWDDTLDYGSTRDDLRRFVSWIQSAENSAGFEEWVEIFALGHQINPEKLKDILTGAPENMCEKFDVDSNGLDIKDISTIRASLNRFLNMVEQSAVAYLNEFGNVDVMTKCMIPTLRRYSGILRPYMTAIRKDEPETWDPIYELHPSWSSFENFETNGSDVAAENTAGRFDTQTSN